MLKFMTHFHERITTLFQNSNTVGQRLFRRWLPGVILIVWFSVAHVMMLNGAQFNRDQQRQQDAIAVFLSDKNESILQRTAGRSYETHAGERIEEWRIHGDKESYRFFFAPDVHAVYNETQDVWETDPLPVPPLLARAFVHWDIGLINSYDGNGHLTIGDVTYEVEEYTVDSVRYNGQVYAPLPALPERTEVFIEEYTEESLDSLELVRQTRTNKGEQLYVRGDESVYQIDIDFDGSASIGTLHFE